MNKLNFNELSIIINILINFQNDPLKASDSDIKILKDYFYYKFVDNFIKCFPHKEFSFKREDFIIGNFGNNYQKEYNCDYLFFKSEGDPCITIAMKYDIYIDKVIDQKIFYDKTKCKFNKNKNNFFCNCGIF